MVRRRPLSGILGARLFWVQRGRSAKGWEAARDAACLQRLDALRWRLAVEFLRRVGTQPAVASSGPLASAPALSLRHARYVRGPFHALEPPRGLAIQSEGNQGAFR